MTFETLLSICLGIGLSASAGFRVFVPLFALSLAAYFNVWELNDSWSWIGSTSALVVLGVATLFEIFAYYMPYVDNLLDAITVPLATIAGTAIMVSTVADLSPVFTWAMAIIAGGGTAAAVAGTTSATRLASTTATAGIANPIVTTLETVTSIVGSVLAVFLPIVAVIFAVIVGILIYKAFKKFKPNRA